MDNRCCIISKDYNKDKIHCYLQWNGGLESILGFLRGAKKLSTHDTTPKIRYDLFSFAACINNWFGDCGYNVYIEHSNDINLLSKTDTDNGVYTIDFDKLEIVKWNTRRGENFDFTTSPDLEKTQAIAKGFYNVNSKIFVSSK